jgi:hypothetical protein
MKSQDCSSNNTHYYNSCKKQEVFNSNNYKQESKMLCINNRNCNCNMKAVVFLLLEACKCNNSMLVVCMWSSVLYMSWLVPYMWLLLLVTYM